MRLQTAENWAASKVEGLPSRWRGRLLDRWAATMAANEQQRVANIELRETVEALADIKLPLDAMDEDIRNVAKALAVQCLDVARIQTPEGVRQAMENFCRSRQVEPPKVEGSKGAINRMTCPDWWTRQLRKLHAKTVEGAAISLGYVNRARDCYVSNESLERRRQQNRRNARMMENTTLRNECGDEFTLAELAAKGTANKAIRRGELMTRIAGFERIAVDCGHEGLFITMTCPSRMHKWISVGEKSAVAENKKYDGTTPKDAQKYLSRVWSRIRAKLARAGLGVYGFRVAEPHHDGCPHWHMLIFHDAGNFYDVPEGQHGPVLSVRVVIEEIFKAYALADSPNEAGAKKYRIKAVKMDASRGSAAAYIAKYIAKNIDGMHVGNDLFGSPALETSGRVEAWAATWGIRQFQQIGGAPVGVWRELRRVKEVPESAPEVIKRAHHAANRIEKGEEVKPAAWDEYIRAQGGPLVGRDHAIRIVTEETGEIGRYGELKAAVPVGVLAAAYEFYSIGRLQASRLVEWLVRSVRHVWEVVKRGVKGVSAAVLSPPWTRVNNCTGVGGDELQRKDGCGGFAGGGKVECGPAAYKSDGGGLCFAYG